MRRKNTRFDRRHRWLQPVVVAKVGNDTHYKVCCRTCDLEYTWVETPFDVLVQQTIDSYTEEVRDALFAPSLLFTYFDKKP